MVAGFSAVCCIRVTCPANGTRATSASGVEACLFKLSAYKVTGTGDSYVDVGTVAHTSGSQHYGRRHRGPPIARSSSCHRMRHAHTSASKTRSTAAKPAPPMRTPPPPLHPGARTPAALRRHSPHSTAAPAAAHSPPRLAQPHRTSQTACLHCAPQLPSRHAPSGPTACQALRRFLWHWTRLLPAAAAMRSGRGIWPRAPAVNTWESVQHGHQPRAELAELVCARWHAYCGPGGTAGEAHMSTEGRAPAGSSCATHPAACLPP